mgnify:FL=1
MNYAEARQLEGGGWHWTTMNDGIVRTSAPCLQIDEHFDPANTYNPPKSENLHRCQPHQTREEAERHFYDYCLEQARVHVHADEMRKCIICQAWTDAGMGNNQMWLGIRPVDLCEKHLTKEFLALAVPFPPEGGISIIHS